MALSIVAKFHNQKVFLMVAQSSKAPHKRIAQEFRGLANDLAIYQTEFKSSYAEAVADDMGKLQALDCLPPEDVLRVWPAINDAARCYHSVHWWPIFTKANKGRHRMQAMIGAVIAAIALIWFYVLPGPNAAYVTSGNVAWSVIITLVILIISSIFHSLVPFRYMILILIAEVGATVTAVSEFQSWSPHVPPIWRALVSSLFLVDPHIRRQMIATPVAGILEMTLWITATICSARLVWRFVNFLAKTTISELELGYGPAAERCSELIIDFIGTCHTITKLLDELQSVVNDDEGQKKWLRVAKLPGDDPRQDIERHLDRLAFRVRKQW